MDLRRRGQHRREHPGEPVGGHGRTKEGTYQEVSPPLFEERHKKANCTHPGGSMCDVHGAEDEQGARVGPLVGRAGVEDLDLVHHGRVEAGAEGER